MKTTNLKILEACEAMIRGECLCSDPDYIYTFKDGHFVRWNGRDKKWNAAIAFVLQDNGWNIVSDPSKPEPKESERAWKTYVERVHAMDLPSQTRTAIELYGNYILALMREEYGE